MTDQRTCSECGSPLGGVIYGECGPHIFTDFFAVPGYKLDVGDLYGDWDTPDYFCIPADKVPRRTTLWTTKARCCHYASVPMADDCDYCPTCQDVTTPAGAPNLD